MEQPYIVQAEFSFRGGNNDELCFKKGDIITVTQREEGGWWEGTLGEITGWFPSNYVKEYKAPLPPSETIRPPEEIQEYRSVVLRDLFESEKAHVAEIQGLLENFLEPLQTSQILTADEYAQLMCNFVEIVRTHEELLRGLENCNDRVGKLFMTKAPNVKAVHQAYCAAHPRAIVILDKYKDDLEKFMERQGAASPGLLVLTTGLSKPFRRLDKYSAMLQELERHMENSHPDRGDTQRSVSVYKDIAATCSATRRQKELELQVLTGPVRGWQGQELSTLGDIIHMGSVAVGLDHRDRYFVLFPQTLLILSVSQRMSAFIYEGKLPLTGIIVNRLEDSDGLKNAFEISGPLIEKIIAVCQGPNEATKWVELLTSTNPSHPVNIKRNVSTSAIGAPQPPAHSSPYFLDTRGYCARFSLYAYSLENPNFRLTLPPQNYPPAAPYTNLTAHFHCLYRDGKLSSNIIKALLYPESLKYVDTRRIIFRRRYKATMRIRKKVDKNDNSKLPRQKAVELSSSSDSEDGSNVVSCDSNPFGYVKFYAGKKCIDDGENYETFIDHEEPPADFNLDNQTLTHRSSLEIASYHPGNQTKDHKSNSKNSKTSPTHTSTARLNLGDIKQQLSETSHISSFDGRIAGNYMACEDLANLKDETKIKADVDTKPIILPDDRHSMPTLFVGNRFNSSSLTEVYLPNWKDKTESQKQSIPDEVEQASWDDHHKVSYSEITDDNYEYNDDSLTTHSSSIDLPPVIPAPDKISAELLYNFDDTIIKPPSPFDCDDDGPPAELQRESAPFRKHSINSDKKIVSRESKESLNEDEKKERKTSMRRCISYQYVKMGSTDESQESPRESHPSSEKTQCKCCKSSQCISQRSSDSGMAGSCTLASPDPHNLSDDFNYPFEVYLDNRRLANGRGLRHSRSSQDLTQFNLYGMYQNRYNDSISDNNSNRQPSIHGGNNLRRGSSRGHSAERTVLRNTKIIYLGMPPPNSSETNLLNRGSNENLGMFKTGLYAHWWKKEKLPNSILREIVRSHKDGSTSLDERKDESSSLSSTGGRGSDVAPSLSRNEPSFTRRCPPNTSTVTTQTEPIIQSSSQLQSISKPSSTTSSTTSTSTSKSVSTKPQIKFSPNLEHFENSKSSSTGAKRKNRKHKSITNLRPAPPLRPNLLNQSTGGSSNALSSYCSRKNQPTFEEDALVLRVIEAYCAAYQNNARNTIHSGLENEDMTPTLRQLWTAIRQMQQDISQMKIQINEERALRGTLQQLLMNHLETIGTSNISC